MRRAERAFPMILFLGELSLPFAIVFGGRFDANAVSIAVRLLALSAFTLIFTQIITGAFVLFIGVFRAGGLALRFLDLWRG